MFKFLESSCSVLLLLLSVGTEGEETDDSGDAEKRAECLMWSYLENKTMPLQDQGHATCTTNKQCTGFTCEGMFQKKPVNFGMKVMPCQEPPGLELFGHAPQFNAYNFSHVFKHGSKYKVPGAMLSSSTINNVTVSAMPPIPGMPDTSNFPGLNVYFVVSMEPNKENNTLTIGLEVTACMNTSIMAGMEHSGPEELCLLKKPIFNNTAIPVPVCDTTYLAPALVGEPCTVGEKQDCGKFQTCAQERDEDKEGRCECKADYVKKSDRTCIHRDELIIPPRSEPVVAQPHTDSESPSSGVGGVVGGVVALLLVVVLLVGLLMLTLRLRLMTRLRARLTNTPYEDIVIQDTNSNRGGGPFA